MSYSCTVNNIHFDKVFVQEVSKSTNKNVQFANGIPLQLSLTFKVICSLPDTEELSTNVIRDYYHQFFGVVISTSSVSRMISDLKGLGFDLMRSYFPASLRDRQVVGSPIHRGP